MRIRLGSGLLLLNLLVVVLIVAISLFPSNTARIVLGLPFVLFFPGYVLILALFPRKEGRGGIERMALSFVLSIAVVSLIGLIVNYTPWGIRLYPVLISLSIFVVVTSVIVWLRQWRLPDGEKFTIFIDLSSWDKQKLAGKVLSIILVAVILGTLGTLVYTIATPKTGDKFTEFYILSLEGKATDYPRELKLGDTGNVVLVIINREQEVVNYKIEVNIDGVSNTVLEPIGLKPNESLDSMVSFTPQRAGDNQKVEFFLYKDGKIEHYLELHLWINVK